MSVGRRIARKFPRASRAIPPLWTVRGAPITQFDVSETWRYGPDEMLAEGSITPERHAGMLAAPKATLVVKSVDRERGIVTFEAAT